MSQVEDEMSKSTKYFVYRESLCTESEIQQAKIGAGATEIAWRAVSVFWDTHSKSYGYYIDGVGYLGFYYETYDVIGFTTTEETLAHARQWYQTQKAH